MNEIQNYCMYKIHDKFKSISKQFMSIYEKCHSLARAIIRATILYLIYYSTFLYLGTIVFLTSWLMPKFHFKV